MNLTRSVVVAIEGPDGVGKTRHARALVEALRADGLPVEHFAHRSPPQSLGGTPPRGRVVWYQQERTLLGARIATFSSPRIVVADRWWHSSDAASRAYGNAFWEWAILVKRAEMGAWEERGLPYILPIFLTAPPEVLDARSAMRASSATVDDLHSQRGEVRAGYASMAQWVDRSMIDTSGDTADVTATIRGRVLATLGMFGYLSPTVPSAPGYDANGSPTL